jgi:superfamily II DNA or RNA helicase
MKIEYDGLYGRITYPNNEAIAYQALRKYFSVLDPDRYAVESFRKGYWDGRYYQITEKGGRFLRGLTTKISDWCKENNIPLQYAHFNTDHQLLIKGMSDNLDKQSLVGIHLAPHQIRMVKDSLDNFDKTISCVTGGGKTESIALLMKILSTKINIIFVLVHRIGLMEQTYRRFCIRVPELAQYCGMLGDGIRPKSGNRFIFSTQQSLSSVLGLKKGRQPDEEIIELWANCGTVIIDECHNVSQNDYLKLLTTVSAPIYQFSGTSETKDQFRDWTIEGVAGSIVCNIARKELEEAGFIAKAVALLRLFE